MLHRSRPARDVIARLEAAKVAVAEGPVVRTGARSQIGSVDVRDPDLNLIEISELAR